MTNDKDSLDIYTTTSLEPAAESDKKGKIEDLLLASFLALALDLILSACRFLSSSSVSPEAATTLSSSHQHYHLSLPLLLFLLLPLSLHHLTYPPSPPCHPLTLVPLLIQTPSHPPTHPPHSAPASASLDLYPFNSDNLDFSNRSWTQ
ncbi:hypothetical protein CgunFtcFv8_000430 [Champsocephalus gunnari]|uniref:Uncharacterized protein n=1 Tax=Champsocephalus gunnari TaxID=52237 RepID=A0AAN8DM39_CHAGU|nr:hypothetical protein CgunFtcFv8_000430 [Champsocephalus gunnari]